MAMTHSHIGTDPRRSAGVLGWRPAAGPIRLQVQNRAELALQSVRHEMLKEGAYLVPVRAFIGIGWLRTFAEKAVEPGWRDGTSLTVFLESQLHAGLIAFPPYQALTSQVFLAHVMLLGWIVMLGQFLAGVAILTGSLTNAALLCGIFMNLNFLLAGVPDPSAFYVVIQMVLLFAGTGAVVGIDAILHTRIRSPLLVARLTGSHGSPSMSRPKALTLVVLALGGAAYATVHIRDWSPSGSVHDPAAILAVLAAMTASWATILVIRPGLEATGEPRGSQRQR